MAASGGGNPARHSPVGGAIDRADLEGDPHPALDALRRAEPVSWIPAIDGWLITDRDLVIAAMRDPATFTVDDPRFSTGLVVGPSMLSLEGSRQRRHRRPFVPPFRPAAVQAAQGDEIRGHARRLVEGLRPAGRAELRTELAGPLGRRIERTVRPSTAGSSGPRPLLGAIADSADLTHDELCSNVAVLMFGAVETSEAMTANALFHLLSHPDQLAALRRDRSLLGNAIDESLRLEPAAAVVDRYATADVRFGRPGAEQSIRRGDLVRLSLTAANHDPSTYVDPHRFDIRRPNAAGHLAFVQGPHACIGIHMAKLETAAGLQAVLDLLPGITADDPALARPTGLIFRKPDRLDATWPAGAVAATSCPDG